MTPISYDEIMLTYAATTKNRLHKTNTFHNKEIGHIKSTLQEKKLFIIYMYLMKSVGKSLKHQFI